MLSLCIIEYEVFLLRFLTCEGSTIIWSTLKSVTIDLVNYYFLSISSSKWPFMSGSYCLMALNIYSEYSRLFAGDFPSLLLKGDLLRSLAQYDRVNKVGSLIPKILFTISSYWTVCGWFSLFGMMYCPLFWNTVLLCPIEC